MVRPGETLGLMKAILFLQLFLNIGFITVFIDVVFSASGACQYFLSIGSFQTSIGCRHIVFRTAGGRGLLFLNGCCLRFYLFGSSGCIFISVIEAFVWSAILL